MVTVRERRRSGWKAALIAAVIVALLAGAGIAGVIGLRSTARPAVAAPASVIGWEPGVVRGVPLAAPISVFFNRSMDHASVQSAWTLSPPVRGSFAWSGTSVTFRPSSPLLPGSYYHLRIGRAALDDHQRHLRSPFSVSFATGDALNVESATPSNGTREVPVNSPITLTFNHPMVALAGLGSPEQNPPGWHVSISPRTSGSGAWLGTSTWIFHPAAGLLPSSAYTVTVSGTTRDAWGLPLGEPVSWTFSTVRPAIVSEVPAQGSSDADPSAPVSVTFNQPMDAASTAQAFSLRDGTGAISGSTSWEGDTLQFQPAVALDPNRMYEATVNGSAVSATGNVRLGTRVSWTFRVSPPPRILSSMPSNGATAAQSFVQIRFSAPMNAESLDRALTVVPALSGMSTYEAGASYSISGDFQPSTAYTVSLSPGAEDRYGRTMQNGYTLRFTTAPLPPAVTLYGSAGVGSGVTLTSGRVEQAPVQVINVPSVHYTLVRTSLAAAPQDQYGTNLSIPKGTTIRSWTVQAPHPLNLVQNLHVQLANPDGTALAPGLYWLGAQAPGSGNQVPSSSELVAVTNAGVTVKVAQHRVLVWATSATTGAPLAGETIRLVSDSGSVIALGTTDARGLRMFTVARSYDVQAAMATGKAFGVAMTGWNGSTQSQLSLYPPPYSSGPPGRYVYTDRPIYRPGQTVHFRAVLWRSHRGVYEAFPARKVDVTAADGAGRSVYRTSLRLDRFGTVHGAFMLPSGAATGYGTISIALSPDKGEAAFTSYAIAAYRKPEFLTSVTSPHTSYTAGQTILATATMTYVFGAPAAGQHVDWKAYAQDRPTQPRGWGTYQFLDAGALQEWNANQPFETGGQGFFGTEIAHGSGTTDGSGTLAIQVPVDLSKVPMDQTITIEATSTDINNQPVSGRIQVAALKAGELIGIAPRKEVVASGKPETVDVAAVSPDGSPIAHASLTETVYRRTYTSRLGGSGISGSLWRQVPHDTQVSSQTFSTGNGGKASFSFTPEQGGDYYVVVTGRDSLGNRARSGVFVYASGAGFSDLGTSNDTSLALQPDRSTYTVGQTARILVAAPAGGTALVTTEGRGILSYRVQRLTSDSTAVRVPITVADIPTIYVTVTLYRGEAGKSPPVWRYGVAELHVSVAPRRLIIRLSQDRARYTPGQRATYTVTTTDSSGRPVSAEVSLALVDTAVLALQPDPNPDILSALYGERPLSVITASDGAVSIDNLHQSARSRVQPGGAGGGGGGSSGPVTVYKHFRDTGYWQADLITGRSGRATFHVSLPDNFTTWRLQARGVTTGFQVGQAALLTVSTRDIVLRPVTPRFFLQGDRLRVGAVVNNVTTRPARIRVLLHASGLLTRARSRTVVVPQAGERLVTWNVAVPVSQRATLTFTEVPTKGSGSGYAVRVRVPVHPPLTEEVAATAGEVFGSTRQEIIVPPGALNRPGDLTIHLSSSLAAGLGHAYRVFAPSRYQSSDDVAARLLAAASLRGVSGSGVGSQAIAHASASLEKRQRADGGWPWFSGASGTSDPLVSADVVTALESAGRTSSLRRARAYLVSQLRTVAPDDRAVLLLAVARTGVPDASASRALFRDGAALQGLSPGSLGDLARALALSGDRAAARSLIARLDADAVVSATGANWEAGELGGGTAVEQTARVLSALVALAPNDPYVPAAARWLMLGRSGPAWDTNRDSALAVSAVAAYARRAHEARASYSYQVAVDGATVLQRTVTPGSRIADSLHRPIGVLRPSGSSFTISRVERAGSLGGGPLYYVAQLHYFLRAGAIRPLSQGISVRRRYINFSGQAVTSVRAGTTLQVELTLQTGRTLTHLALNDPIPAGFEPINQSLSTSRQGLFKAWLPLGASPGTRNLSFYATHTDLQDDRVSVYAESLPPGTYQFTYLVQATVAGSYGVPPTRASETFFPDVFGRSGGQVVSVR